VTPAEQEAPSHWTDDSELRRYRQVWKQLEIIDGVLHRRVSTSGRKDGLVLVVPRKMRADLLQLSHNDPSSGHMGINRCVERLQPWYYWPGMTSEVHLWVAECDACATEGNRRQHPTVPPWRTSEYLNQWSCEQWTS
jgi:hypothetical protein